MYRNLKVFFCFALLSHFMPPKEPFAGTLITANMHIQQAYDQTYSFDGNGDKVTIEDFITQITPRLDLATTKPSFDIHAAYSLNSSFYKKVPNRDHTAHNGNIRITSNFSQRASLTLQDTLTITDTNTTASDDSTQAVIWNSDQDQNTQTNRSKIISNTTSLNLTNIFSNSFTSNLSFSEEFLLFSQDDLVDTRTDTAGLSLTKRLSEVRDISLNYNYTNLAFEEAYSYSFDASEDGDNTGNHTLSLEFTDRLFPSVEINLSGGGVYSPEQDFFSGRGDFVLTKTFKTSTVGAEVHENVTDSSGFEPTISKTTTGGIRWHFVSGRLIDSLFTVTSERRKTFRNSETDSELKADSFTLKSVIGLNVNRETSLNFEYSFFKQWSEDDRGRSVIWRDGQTFSLSGSDTSNGDDEIVSQTIGLTITRNLSQWSTFNIGYSQFVQWAREAREMNTIRDYIFINFTMTHAGWKL